MVNAILEQELSACLERLPPDQQRRVLEFAQALFMSSPQGIEGGKLVPFSGSIEESDLEAMSNAIEQGCERIDDEW